jgi:hypothetical protein
MQRLASEPDMHGPVPALVHAGEVLLVDEPPGALDEYGVDVGIVLSADGPVSLLLAGATTSTARRPATTYQACLSNRSGPSMPGPGGRKRR